MKLNSLQVQNVLIMFIFNESVCLSGFIIPSIYLRKYLGLFRRSIVHNVTMKLRQLFKKENEPEQSERNQMSKKKCQCQKKTRER